MSLQSLTLLAAIVFTVAYLILAVRALSYVNQEERARGSYWLLIMDPWWPFHNKMYEESGKRIVLYGRILFPLALIAYVLWLVQLWN